jgi:hypothetical protein
LGSSGCDGMCNAFVKKFKKKKRILVLSKKKKGTISSIKYTPIWYASQMGQS